MELCAGDNIIANPSAADVTAAIDAGPHDDDWILTLDPGEDSYIEAVPAAADTYDVTAITGKRRVKSATPVDAARLTTIFLKYLAGDKSWRGVCQWSVEAIETKKAIPLKDGISPAPPAWAMAVMIATIGFVVLIFSLPDSWVRMLPYSDSDLFYIGLIGLPMVMLIVVMVISKLSEANAAKNWAQTSGRVVKSTTRAVQHQFAGEQTTVKTVPVVEYEFTAQGRKWRGNRISIGDDVGGENLEATLKRYPSGATVTVFYDAKDPNHCVLERDVPKDFAKGCAAIAAIAIGGIAALYYLTTHASQLLAHTLPDGNAPLTVFAACFGLACLLFFFGIRHAAKKAMRWPVTQGEVVSSSIERIEKREDGRNSVSYSAAVEYRYTVNDVEYHSRQINLGMVTSGSESAAAKVIARYPKGSAVEVHYDPKNPNNAALENPTGYSWIVLGAAVFCLGIAVYSSGILK